MRRKERRKIKSIGSMITFIIFMILLMFFQKDYKINVYNNIGSINEINNNKIINSENKKTDNNETNNSEVNNESNNSGLDNIPEYAGNIYVELNNNIPNFTEQDFNIQEPYYSELNNNRAGMAMIKTNWTKANEDNKKDDYTSINPSGYIQKKYDKSLVKGGYLYHRSHIIAWKLGGVDTDVRNLLTGTRDFNEEGMKKFEDIVYEYLKDNKQNSVLYRATPYYEGENKLASRNKIRSFIN